MDEMNWVYDAIMNYGPVLVAGGLTLLGVRMTLRHNYKLAFNSTINEKLALVADVEAILDAEVSNSEQFTARKESLEQHLKSIQEQLLPMIIQMCETIDNTDELRKAAVEFRIRNDYSDRFDFKHYKQHQTSRLELMLSIVRGIDNDLKKKKAKNSLN